MVKNVKVKKVNDKKFLVNGKICIGKKSKW